MITSDTPLPDIEAAIRSEVEDINAKRPRPTLHMRPLPRTEEDPPLLPPQIEPAEPVPLPVVLSALAGALEDLDERVAQRLARIERALGISS